MFNKKTINRNIVRVPHKSDLETMLDLQRKYDELQADCKALLSVIASLSNSREEPKIVEFYNPDESDYLSACLEMIREHATWNKK